MNNDPTPTGTEAEVCADIARRQQIGLKKYGTSLRGANLSRVELLTHAYTEALDLAIYLKEEIAKDYVCPVCEDVRLRLKGHRCSRLDGEHGLAAATMRAWEQEWWDGASGEAGAMLRRELRSVIRRYGQESDVTAYQAIGALRMVEHDIVDMLDSAA